MLKKRVIKREIGVKHTRARAKNKTVKVRTNMVLTNNEIEDVVDTLIEKDVEKSRKPKKTKVKETVEISVDKPVHFIDENENNE